MTSRFQQHDFFLRASSRRAAYLASVAPRSRSDIGGRKLGPMVPTEVCCGGKSYRHDIAVLVFRTATEAST
jgi:hypothetical protein